MKKLFMIALILSCVGGITMAQANPSKKTSTPATTKTEVKKKDTAGSAGAAADMGKHHKKKAAKNSK